MYIGLQVKYPLLFLDINQAWIFSTAFEKSADIKFHENPSSRSRVVQMRKDKRGEANSRFPKYF